MPKKQKIKTDEGVTLDAAQAAEVRKQIYEGSYSLGAPNVTVNDEEVVVTVSSKVYTVHGDSTIVTTTSYSSEGFEESVRNALERSRKAAEATIKAIDDDIEANYAGPDDEDEGLREGPVVSGGPYAGFMSRSDAEARDTSSEGLKRRIAFAKGLVREFDTASAREAIEARLGIIHGDDEISIPNAEYAELLSDRRRLEALEIEASGISPSNAFERPVPTDEGAAPAGEIDIATFVAATTGDDAAFDTSNTARDDGGPVEPGLDIDALVAGVDVQRDTCSLDIRAVRFPVELPDDIAQEAGEFYEQYAVVRPGIRKAEAMRHAWREVIRPRVDRCLEATSVDPKADAEAIQRIVGTRV